MKDGDCVATTCGTTYAMDSQSVKKRGPYQYAETSMMRYQNQIYHTTAGQYVSAAGEKGIKK